MWQSSIKNGGKIGLKTTWSLGKIIFPITLIVVVLQHTPVLPWLVKLIEPFMRIFGLSGDAAIPLVLGTFLNLYAAIAGVLSVDLTVKEVFIIAVMMSFAHNLLIESSVAVKVGVKVWVILTVRIGLAIISAITINLVWNGGQEIAQYGMIQAQSDHVEGISAIVTIGLKKGLFRRLSTSADSHSANDWDPASKRLSVACGIFPVDGPIYSHVGNEGEYIDNNGGRVDVRSCIWCWCDDPGGQR